VLESNFKLIRLAGDIRNCLGKNVKDFDAWMIKLPSDIWPELPETSVNNFFVWYYCYDVHYLKQNNAHY
jgi:hypothetical protein